MHTHSAQCVRKYFPKSLLKNTSHPVENGWLTIQDPAEALSACAQHYLCMHKMDSPLHLTMDIRKSSEEQDMALISFYKRPHVKWASPLKCTLEGDPAVGDGLTHFFFSQIIHKIKTGFCINFANSNMTRFFEGEPGHLVPSASHFLVESDMFTIVGRMLGHCFLHRGPRLSGLSPALIHVMLGGSPETATVTLEDCPDLDIRETIFPLQGQSKLTEQEKKNVQDLAFAWDLPVLTEQNRRWLFEKLLLHAVIGRVTRQIKQLRRGLKESPIWSVLTQRTDTAVLLFPQDDNDTLSPELILHRITWPSEEEDEDDDCTVDDKRRIVGFLRQFICNAKPGELTNLVKFWSGWEVLPEKLSVEVVCGTLPTSSTCFETLRIPGHYQEYSVFKFDLTSAINTCHTGFDLV